MTREELWEEYRAWEIFHTPPPEPDSVEDAWQEAVHAGQYDPADRAARRVFIAQWHAAHPAAEDETAEDEWIAVTEPPPRPPGGESDGP